MTLFIVQKSTIYFLVQLLKFEIIRIAACFLVVESIDAHVGFLHLLGSIIKRGGGVLHGCYCHYHIGSEDGTVRAFEALRLYLKYLTHKHSVLGSLYITVPAFAKTANHLLLGAKIRKICEPNKSIMVHNEKKWRKLAQTISRSFYVSIYQISTYRTE